MCQCAIVCGNALCVPTHTSEIPDWGSNGIPGGLMAYPHTRIPLHSPPRKLTYIWVCHSIPEGDITAGLYSVVRLGGTVKRHIMNWIKKNYLKLALRSPEHN